MKIPVLISATLFLLFSIIEAVNCVNAFEATTTHVILSMLAVVGANIMIWHLIFHDAKSRLFMALQMSIAFLWLTIFFILALISLGILTLSLPIKLASSFVSLQISVFWFWVYFIRKSKEQTTN